MEKTSKSAAAEKYFEGIGRRKTSIARARLHPAKTKDIDMAVNKKPYKEYFPTVELRKIAEEALTRANLAHEYKVTVKVKGGGINGQAEAVRHGIARAILAIDPELRRSLKQEGYLKRDPRAKERRKFGLKKARKAPQWAKR